MLGSPSGGRTGDRAGAEPLIAGWRLSLWGSRSGGPLEPLCRAQALFSSGVCGAGFLPARSRPARSRARPLSLWTRCASAGKDMGYLVARRETSRAFLGEEQVCLQLGGRGCDGEDAGPSAADLPGTGTQSPHFMCAPPTPKTRSGDGHVSICLCVSRISKVRERRLGACVCGGDMPD